MRIISKPKRSDNGFPIIGTVTLLKDSVKKNPKDSFYVWEAYGIVEHIPKGTRDESIAYSIKAMSPLADMLIEWPAKTKLFIAGELVKDDYWSSRRGSEVYYIKAEFVHDQHNYAAAAKDSGQNDDDYDGAVSESSYDPGF